MTDPGLTPVNPVTADSAPRLVTRAILASFIMVVAILGTLFLMLSVDIRQRVRQSVVENLDAGQQLFAHVEERRQEELLAMVTTLAEHPTLKAALDTWQSERRAGEESIELVHTVQREAEKLAARVGADVLAILDVDGHVVASAGPKAAVWQRGTPIRASLRGAALFQDFVVALAGGAFRVTGVPLEFGDAFIGTLELGVSLDYAHARELASLARGDSAILVGDRVLATTLSGPAAADLAALGPIEATASTLVELGGEAYAIRQVDQAPPATFLALASVDAGAVAMTRSTLRGLGWIAVAAAALAAGGSLWLARTLTRPIDRLSASVTTMIRARDFDTALPTTGVSRELDLLTHNFNALIRSLADAEAQTQAAYLGAIRALAAALDARDPYTAGHSERVSALSVAMGMAMGLGDDELSTLRLGALLHDIGKIGVPDEVLGKPSALTPTEFALIRTHPVIGARILRSIPFLAPHLPIVELHHERPDGTGYPYGLVGDSIPLAARIVHVADAYDAITSARAYRAARAPQMAIVELQTHAGSDFDRAAVEALVAALPRLPAMSASFDAAAFQFGSTFVERRHHDRLRSA
jgi:putative nucleotidyltransferase with HDIG domain